MKKLFSKWLSGVLALVMVMGMLPGAIFADNSGSGDQPGTNGVTSITVTVRDSADTSKVLSGVGVKLERMTSGQYEDLGIQYTDSTGTTTWSNLVSGLYRITQTSTIDGYKMSTVSQQRWFGTDEGNHSVDIFNYPEVTLTVLRLANGEPIQGSTVEVRDTDGGVVYQGVTNESGAILFGTIAPGDYAVYLTNDPAVVDAVH